MDLLGFVAPTDPLALDPDGSFIFGTGDKDPFLCAVGRHFLELSLKVCGLSKAPGPLTWYLPTQ